MTLKTQPTDSDVEALLAAIEDPARQADARALCALMTEATGEPPALWGTSIIGFGTYHYQPASGKGYPWMRIGFAARKNDLTLYIGLSDPGVAAAASRIGPHKEGKGCLYLKRLAGVDEAALKELLATAYARPLGTTEG